MRLWELKAGDCGADCDGAEARALLYTTSGVPWYALRSHHARVESKSEINDIAMHRLSAVFWCRRGKVDTDQGAERRTRCECAHVNLT